MSLFRPGPPPQGVQVQRPVWQVFAEEPESSPDRGISVTAARLEAARILQEAADMAEAAVAESSEAGFKHGYEEGLNQGRAELQSLQEQAEAEAGRLMAEAESARATAAAQAEAVLAQARLEAQSLVATARREADQLLAAARTERLQRLDEAQEALVELVVAAAVRLVQGQLAIRPDAVVQMITAGLRRLKDHDCKVRVNPQDLPLLEAQRMVLERELGSGVLQLTPDMALERGSFMIASPQGNLDGRVASQAAHLKVALAKAVGG